MNTNTGMLIFSSRISIHLYLSFICPYLPIPHLNLYQFLYLSICPYSRLGSLSISIHQSLFIYLSLSISSVPSVYLYLSIPVYYNSPICQFPSTFIYLSATAYPYLYVSISTLCRRDAVVKGVDKCVSVFVFMLHVRVLVFMLLLCVFVFMLHLCVFVFMLHALLFVFMLHVRMFVFMLHVRELVFMLRTYVCVRVLLFGASFSFFYYRFL